MKKSGPPRRDFIKMAAGGLGGLLVPPASAFPAAASVEPPGKKYRVVCVGAHPGDPEFGCGGTMAKYARAGHAVTFLYLTRGEASDLSKSFQEMATLRTKEAETACRLLQVKPLFAGQIDGSTVLSKEKNEEMTRLILAEEPDFVFTQWPLDSHPDHQVTGMLALTAWIKTGKKFQLYFYEVNTGSETMHFTPTDRVDITDTLELKKAAMFAHRTQDPETIYRDYFKTLEEFRGLEAGVKAAEAFIHFQAGATPQDLL